MSASIRSIRLRNRKRANRYGYRVWRSKKLISRMRRMDPKKYRAMRRLARNQLEGCRIEIVQLHPAPSGFNHQ